MKQYYVVRWAPIPFAILFVCGIAVVFPHVVLTAFWLNSLWVPYVGNALQWIGEVFLAPYLPPLVWEAVIKLIATVHSAYDKLVVLLQTATQHLPEEYGARTEVFVRGYLAEGWLLVAEVSAVIRFFLIKKVFA